jgi:hypothetical protein
MKEAPGSSETSVLTRATRRNNPEDTILQLLVDVLKSQSKGKAELLAGSILLKPGSETQRAAESVLHD